MHIDLASCSINISKINHAISNYCAILMLFLPISDAAKIVFYPRWSSSSAFNTTPTFIKTSTGFHSWFGLIKHLHAGYITAT